MSGRRALNCFLFQVLEIKSIALRSALLYRDDDTRGVVQVSERNSANMAFFLKLLKELCHVANEQMNLALNPRSQIECTSQKACYRGKKKIGSSL